MATAVSSLRLSQPERDGIRRAVVKACESQGIVWCRILLFGSRTDPSRRGGDIDLLIELDPRRPGDVYQLSQRLRITLEEEIGAQRVDLVFDDGGGPAGFPAIAREQGVELWLNT